MSLVRAYCAASCRRLAVQSSSRLSVATLSSQRRSYASKRKGDKDDRAKHNPVVSTSDLVPGSQQKLAGAEYQKTEEKMKGIVEKFRKDVAAMEMRASGRVTPQVLAPVRVTVPEDKGGDGKSHRLEEIATVGVREGTTLIVTVFDEPTLKYVESAIFDAKLPGVMPQRLDSRTLKIPMPKATVETRNTMVTAAQRQAEEVRQLVRKQHSASIKKGNYRKHAPELDELQTLANQYLADVDKILSDIKKGAGGK